MPHFVESLHPRARMVVGLFCERLKYQYAARWSDWGVPLVITGAELGDQDTSFLLNFRGLTGVVSA